MMPKKALAGGEVAVLTICPATVTLRVTAFPATAKLFWDGELLPSNPMTRSYPIDSGGTHRLVARAEGYDDEEREIKLDQDIDVVLTLREKPREVPTQIPKPTLKKRPAKAARSEPTARHSGQCDPPFVIDDRGVKKYKAQCL